MRQRQRESEKFKIGFRSTNLTCVTITKLLKHNFSCLGFLFVLFSRSLSLSFFLLLSLYVKCLYAHQYTQDLRRLNLAENLIVELVPRVFYMLGKLKYLSLSGNPLNDLPPDVFKDILVSDRSE